MYNPQPLKEVYQKAKEKVYSDLEERKRIKPVELSDLEKKRLSKNTPLCIRYILTKHPEKSAKVNFNKQVMTLVNFFQKVEISEPDAWKKVQPFIENYPHSDTYDTVEKRKQHWDSQWLYLQDNPDYQFSCSYIKGFGFPGSAFECSDCIETQTQKEKCVPDPECVKPSSFSSEEIMEALRANEDGDADLYKKMNRGLKVLDHSAGKEGQWYNRKIGGHWVEDEIGQSAADVRKVVKIYELEVGRKSVRRANCIASGKDKEAQRLDDEITRLAKRMGALQARQRKFNVLQLSAMGADSLGISGNEWDNAPYMLGCTNGTIDLRTGELKSIDPNDFLRTIAPTKYEGIDTPCPVWEKFMEGVFDNNAQHISLMQRILGYGLIGEVTEDIFPVLWGEDGRNGKDTLFDGLGAALDAYARPIESELLLAQRYNKRAGAPSPELIHLRGKRITWASEVEEHRAFDKSKIKLLTGGGSITARAPYGKRQITFSPSHTLFLITNPKPKARGYDPAFWERVILIPLTQRFVTDPQGANEHKADIYMLQKLKKEAGGMLAWLVRGCLEWQKSGLNIPKDIKDATNDYKGEEDIVELFLDECCTITPNVEVGAGRLYQEYKSWCQRIGEKHQSNTAFGKRMKKVFDHYRNKKGNHYVGVELADTGKNDPNFFENTPDF